MSLLKAALLVAVLLAVIDARGKRPKPKPKPKWVTRKGVTSFPAEGKHPAFDCSFSIKYKKKGGSVKSQMKCKKVDSPSVTPPPANENSCKDKCGSGYDSSLACQCNSFCPQYNNCCSDYAQLCTGNSTSSTSAPSGSSCQGKCGNGYDSSLDCQCNSLCPQYNNCCSDYDQICAGTSGSTSAPQVDGCTLALPDSKDPHEDETMPAWPPLILDQSNNLLVANETSGVRRLTVPSGQTVTLYCPKTSFENYQGANLIRVTCNENKDLDSPDVGPVTNLADLGCDKQYREDFVETGEACGPAGMEGELVHVGFTVNSTFYWQFTSCHQASRAHNLWVHHKVLAAAMSARDESNNRPSFSKDGFYSGYDINGMYTKNSQKEVVAGLVGSSSLAETYFPGGDVYIARGHLAPNADFMTYAWQDATFTFIDVAPQWQSFNAGNWLDIENGVRYLAEKIGDLLVWTGTHGILQLADPTGALVDIYLDDEDNEKVPVPKFFWKVIVDSESKRGIAMLGSNNPHAAQAPPCSNITQEVTWLSYVNTADIEAGPLTACTVEDFAAAVPEFPGGVDTSGGLLL